MKRQWLALGLVAMWAGSALAGELDEQFRTPPDSTRPWVYWFWLNSNLTREGITADLEAMKRVGIGGVLIMEVDQGAPVGSVAFMGPKWRELFQHVVAEAQRLGLEVNMNNDAGWNGSGGPWIKPEQSMQRVVWTETRVEGGRPFRGPLPPPQANAGYYRDIAVLALPLAAGATPEQLAYRIQNIEGKSAVVRAGIAPDAPYTEPPAACVTPRDRIVDLTMRMDAKGQLAWDAPPGRWIVLRTGHTTTGAQNAPAPATGCGLECDKLSKEGIEANFAGMMEKIINDVGPAAGKTLVATHVDSWENGSQNWTPRMREEFQRRRGYDMLPFLPVMTGRVVDSLEVSERFLWDLRQTISDLLVENYAGHLAKLAQRRGLRLSIEAYDGPCDDMTYAGRADEPMAEFWMGGGRMETAKEMSSAAHVYGRPITGAESFTADDHERWLQHPATIKTLGDTAFCLGVNRFVFHRYAMQPWADRKPGMTMGPWGLHYERTATWWEQSRGWHQYLARCQLLLRQGLFAADVCYLQAEIAPQGFQFHGISGYDYDSCTPEVVLTRMTVKDGRLVLPDGMTYRLLVLPPVGTMTPPLLAKIKQLAEDGATVLGTRPSKSPSLTDYPMCDEQVKKLADELWGDCDGKTVKEHAVGKGKVLCGLSPEDSLRKADVPPDFTGAGNLRWIHRRAAGSDVYFVANGSPQPAEALCSFRVGGKRPELWQPETGRIDAAPVYEQAKGCTWLPIRLDPSGSVFVVFRSAAEPAARIVSVTRNGSELLRSNPARDPKRDATRTFTMSVWVKPGAETALPRETNAGAECVSLDRNDVLYPPPVHEVYAKSPGVYLEGHAGAGIAAGTNGVCVHEHGSTYFPAILVYPAPLRDWTHVAVVYRDGTPSLYLNGKLVRTGLKSAQIVHGGVGIMHSRGVAPFRGQFAGLAQFDRALAGAEIAKLAATRPVAADDESLPPIDLVRGEIARPGSYAITTADGRRRLVEVPSLPKPLEIAGPWELSFAPGLGAPPRVTLEKLISWTEHAVPGVKYFSGAATYGKTFRAPPGMVAQGRAVYLDLGRVQVMAAVRLNGKDLGTLWKAPFCIDATAALQPGENTLQVKVVNLWPNRMIGDEELPEDSLRRPEETLQKWPQWLIDGKPSPTGRVTFTTWKLWKKGEPLVESGLLGPVTLRAVERLDAAAP
jgi:hypothetical protein